ncbi:MAG: hypothetical protein HYU88_12180 [Chloroflexi bacterium]|nr:hypothetical protein [Chloroflexota bacterium]
MTKRRTGMAARTFDLNVPWRLSIRWLSVSPPQQLTPKKQTAPERVLAADPELARGYALLQRFRRLVA